jgi:N-acetylmuramoyl-L-alanine amidase
MNRRLTTRGLVICIAAVTGVCALVVTAAVAMAQWSHTPPAATGATAASTTGAPATAAGSLSAAGPSSPAPAASPAASAAGSWSVSEPSRLPPTHAPYVSAGDNSASDTPLPSASPSANASQSPTATPSPSATPTTSAAPPPPKPAIIRQLIPFGAHRRAETVAYNRRHYGQATWRLNPRVIVLHYTAGGTEAGAHATFAANTPNMGVLPGVVAHFVIDKNGKIYQQLSLGIRGRHTVGLNYVAIGIEFVQDAGPSSTWATNQIFARTAQIRAGLRLVRWLQWRYHIATRDVVGHATANRSRYFKDLLGWRNTHTDWNAAAVRRFHALLA